MAFSFRKLFRSLKGMQFGGYGGGYGYNDPWGGYFRTLPGSQFDYRREAGILWDNGIVLACVKWACRSFPEAVLVAQVRGSHGMWETLDDHPALRLLRNPNPYYDASLLWSGVLLSWMVDGNGYWFASRSRAGIPAELYYMPHFQVSPRWPADGRVYVSHYEYRTDRRIVELPTADILHFRNGIDPQNIRRGLSDLGAVLREVCTDNEAATAAAAMMRNRGIPGLIFTLEKDSPPLTQEQLQALRERASEKMTGDRRGELMALPVPGRFETVGFTPEQMAFDKIRSLPEERITGALGIPAIVAGMGAGLDRSTFSNMESAREYAYESFLVPLWRVTAHQLTHQLLPMFGEDPETTRLHFDVSEVRALQESEDDRHGRIGKDYRNGILKRAEARSAIGYPQTSEDDVYFTDTIHRMERIVDDITPEDR